MLRGYKVLLIVLTSFSSLFAQEPIKPVTITGRLLNGTDSTPKVMVVNFMNPFDKVRKSVELSQDSDFFVYQQMLFTQNMTLAYNDTYINLYVAPGDSVHLEIDGSKLNEPGFKWLTISGDHAEWSRQLNLVHRYIHTLPVHRYDYSLPAGELLTAVKSDYDRYLEKLQNYSNKNQIDPPIVDFMKRDIKYSIANQISDYVQDGDRSPSSAIKRKQLFKDVFFDNGNDRNFMTMMYPYYLSMNTDWAIESLKSTENTAEVRADSESLQAGVMVIMEEAASFSRDYMLFTYLASLLKKNPELSRELQGFQAYFTNPVIFRYLEQGVNPDKDLQLGKSLIKELYFLQQGQVSNLSQVDFLEVLQNRYPGKVIYLDIFATWCAPCLKEMESAPALHDSFQGEDVVFVNLCMSSQKENWLNLVKERGISGENYFIDGDDSSALMGNFNIAGFPTYMLIDKQGSLSTREAIRPSELENAREEIQKLL